MLVSVAGSNVNALLLARARGVQTTQAHLVGRGPCTAGGCPYSTQQGPAGVLELVYIDQQSSNGLYSLSSPSLGHEVRTTRKQGPGSISDT